MPTVNGQWVPVGQTSQNNKTQKQTGSSTDNMVWIPPLQRYAYNEAQNKIKFGEDINKSRQSRKIVDGVDPALKNVQPVGENLFLHNVLPIKQNDNVAVKAGKGLVNAVASTADAPFELARHFAIGSSNALIGKSPLDVPKETSFAGDIIAPALPQKTVKKYAEFTQEHPIMGAASQALIDAADPAMWVGVGGIDKFNPLLTQPNKSGLIRGIDMPSAKARVNADETINYSYLDDEPAVAKPDFFVDPNGIARTSDKLPAMLPEGKPTAPILNLEARKGEISYPSESIIKQQLTEQNPSIAFKRESSPAVDYLNTVLEKRSGYSKRISRVESAPEAMEKPDFKVANLMAEANTGWSVIPVKGLKDTAGVALGKRIFLNKETKQPVLYVTNHEIIHTIETTNPEAHARLMQIVQEHIADAKGINKHYTELGYAEKQIPKELTSDAMAESMLEPSFWQRVRQQAPELIKPILDAIDNIISAFKGKVGEDMSIMQYLKDVEVMRDRLAVEYQGYLAEMKGGKLQGMPEGAAAKLEPSLKLDHQNRTDKLRTMVEYGAANTGKGKVNFESAMRQQFSDLFDGYSPEVQSRLLTDIWKQSQQLAKTGKTTIRVGQESLDVTQKARKLGLSAAKAPWAKEEYIKALNDEITPEGRGAYETISNEQTLADAQKALDADAGAVVRRILSDAPSDRIDNTAGLLLVKQANETGDIQMAVDLTEALAKKATEAGQAIQALSMWSRLTPEGMLSYAQKVIARANFDLTKLGYKNTVKLDEKTAQKIVDLMKQAEGLEGRARDIKTAQALDVIASQIPPNKLQVIASLQTMAQLLNPKTATRNIIGNIGFAGMENISDVVGAGIDKTTSLITGNRAKVLPSLGTQAKGAAKGFKLGLEDALLGIDTSNMAGGKFDLPRGRVFRSGPLSYMEKALNIELKATDRAFYQAAYDESMRQQAAAAKLSKKAPTIEQMEEIAHHDALYRTFQDDSLAAKAFSGIKRALNANKDFGIGDFVIKYPKTPGNLLSRGIEYSPAGFIKTVLELGKPLMGREFNQKAFVESFSRALVGSTMLVGTGAILHKLGIITGKANEDYDIENLNAQAGFGEYRINVSGLKRFITSGFNPSVARLRKGDTTISYDWFQPNAIGLAMGADINQNKGQKKGIVGKLGSLATLGGGGVVSGINAFADQPVLQGVEQLFSGQKGDVATGLLKMLEGVPASFVPTLLNQVKQLMDNQKRTTYSPDYLDEMKNKTIAKVPGLNKSLPQSYGTLGQPLQTYQTDNNAFNVLINPAFVSKYNPSLEAQKVLDIYNESGDKTVFPRTVDKYITYTPKGGNKSERIDLTSEEYSEFQRLTGEYTREGLSRLSDNISVERRAEKVNKILDDAAAQAKEDILKKRGIKVKSSSGW